MYTQDMCVCMRMCVLECDGSDSSDKISGSGTDDPYPSGSKAQGITSQMARYDGNMQKGIVHERSNIS